MPETITITGNLAEDPRRYDSAGGVTITTFRVASPQRRYDRAKQSWVEGPPNWYSVSAFRSLAENAHVSLRKGDRVLVSGRLRLRAWDTGSKQGITAEIDAEALGHDLLWGTTTFERTSRSGGQWGREGGDGVIEVAREQEAGEHAAPAVVGVGADGWAAPGATPF